MKRCAAEAVPLYVGRMLHQFDHRAANVGVNLDNLHKDGILTFASSFLQSIAQMIIQALALKLILSSTKLFGEGGATSGIAGFISSIVASAAPLGVAAVALTAAGKGVTEGGAAVGAGAVALGVSARILQDAADSLAFANGLGNLALFHAGGIVGTGSGQARQASSALFAGAVRYHSGGLAGLRPNEVPAILQRGEEVLTTSDSRHRFNGGGGSGQSGASQPLHVKVVNTMDAGEFISSGMATAVGERTILNFMRANKTSIKSILG